jgi:hypothetical protein
MNKQIESNGVSFSDIDTIVGGVIESGLLFFQTAKLARDTVKKFNTELQKYEEEDRNNTIDAN